MQTVSRNLGGETSVGLATTQNLVVKFDGEICGGVLVENASDDFPSKKSSKISFQTSPEVRHQFRRKLRQLHSGNRWCLLLQFPNAVVLNAVGRRNTRTRAKERNIERKRAQTQVRKRAAQKSIKQLKKERFCVKIANNQV